VRINIDVLNSQSQLYQTKRDLAQARYNVLLGNLKLRQANGTLTVDDMNAINATLAKNGGPSSQPAQPSTGERPQPAPSTVVPVTPPSIPVVPPVPVPPFNPPAPTMPSAPPPPVILNPPVR
jgi:outer membrane protein